MATTNTTSRVVLCECGIAIYGDCVERVYQNARGPLCWT